MKLSSLLLFAFISTLISLTACKDTKGDATTETPTSTVPEGGIVEPPTTLSTGTTGGSTEKHYKCPTAGCTGSGDAQGKCPVCGAELVHNQAFHGQTPSSTPGSSPLNPVQVNPTNGTPTTTPGSSTPATAVTPPSAKNAKGVYHYTCPKGHEGAASAGNCPKCGETMTHNQAYHD